RRRQQMQQVVQACASPSPPVVPAAAARGGKGGGTKRGKPPAKSKKAAASAPSSNALDAAAVLVASRPSLEDAGTAVSYDLPSLPQPPLSQSPPDPSQASVQLLSSPPPCTPQSVTTSVPGSALHLRLETPTLTPAAVAPPPPPPHPIPLSSTKKQPSAFTFSATPACGQGAAAVEDSNDPDVMMSGVQEESPQASEASSTSSTESRSNVDEFDFLAIDSSAHRQRITTPYAKRLTSAIKSDEYESFRSIFRAPGSATTPNPITIPNPDFNGGDTEMQSEETFEASDAIRVDQQLMQPARAQAPAVFTEVLVAAQRFCDSITSTHDIQTNIVNGLLKLKHVKDCLNIALGSRNLAQEFVSGMKLLESLTVIHAATIAQWEKLARTAARDVLRTPPTSMRAFIAIAKKYRTDIQAAGWSVAGSACLGLRAARILD
ncbi:MAG: hypothetical protein P4M11_02220, partial [Candidatus Pacebacteria bacterium]|nr:hypothetical protein [Candidatus Paceibacterota bacterium]